MNLDFTQDRQDFLQNWQQAAPAPLLLITEPKKADAKRLMAIMSMGVKKGHTVTVTVEGDNEEADFETVEKFFKENL